MNSRPEQLVRGLRRWDVVALVINSIIGAGIFGLPSRVFALAGTYSLLAYVASAVVIVLIILCMAEVGSRFTATGGPYLYARVAFGPVTGFQVGWLMWISRVAAFAALCNLFIGYLGYFVPAASGEPWRPAAVVGVIAAVSIANMAGVRVTAAVTNALTVGKLIPLLLVAGVGLFFIDPQRFVFATFPASGSFAQAALLLVFAYMGFENAAIPTGEMRDPARHLPFALFTGLGAVVLLYVLIQTVCIGIVPDLAHSERPLSDASLGFMGAPGASLIAAGAMMSIGGTMNAIMFAAPRLLFAMAENRQLPQALAWTHPRSHTPLVAILLTLTAILGATLFSTFISALTVSVIIRLLTYSTTCAALPALRRNSGVPQPAFVVPGGSLIAVAAVILSAWLLSSSSWSEARVVAVAVGVGFVLYALCARVPRGAAC